MVMNADVSAGPAGPTGRDGTQGISAVMHVHEAQRINRELLAISAAREDLELREIPLLQQASALETWTVFGCVTLNEYLERVLGYKPRTAQEKVRVARALVELPVLREALHTKQLAYWRVRELTRVATPATEAAWLEETRDLDARSFEAFIAEHAKGDEPGKPSKSNDLVKVTIRLRPETAEWWHQQRGRVAAERGERGVNVTDDDVVAALRDAAEGSAGADGPSIRTFVATCRSCHKQWQTRGGAQLPADPVTVAMAQCDSVHLGDVEADTPARVRKTVSKRMRENVLARDDHRCSVPGCRARRFLDVHHIHLKSRGGPNRASNLTVLCAGHHQRLHDGQLTITGIAPHALVFAWTNPAAQARHAPAMRTTPTPPADGLTDMQRLSRAIEEALS